MATITDVAQGILDVMASVPDVGGVYPYMVVPDDLDTGVFSMREWALYNGKVRFWNFWRTTHERLNSVAGDDNSITQSIFDWTIEGYYQTDKNGESEIPFNELIEQVQDAFLANRTLNGSVTDVVVDDRVGAQVIDHDTLNWSGVICHYIQLSLITLVDESPVYGP